jgi:hypothetical protein
MLNVTHTHSAPDPDCTEAYRNRILERGAEAVVDAWKNRKPAGISRALGYAVTDITGEYNMQTEQRKCMDLLIVKILSGWRDQAIRGLTCFFAGT